MHSRLRQIPSGAYASQAEAGRHQETKTLFINESGDENGSYYPERGEKGATVPDLP
jgi:hypothetical protein